MMFDERTISRGLDDLAVKWNPKYEKFQAAPVPQKKRDWLYVATSAPTTPVSVKIAPQATEIAPNTPISLLAIRKAVMEVCRINEIDFNSNRQTHYFCRPRQLFYYLGKKHSIRSFPEIGRFAGGRDHSTVIHGVKKIKSMIESGDAQIIAQLSEIERVLGVGQ